MTILVVRPVPAGDRNAVVASFPVLAPALQQTESATIWAAVDGAAIVAAMVVQKIEFANQLLAIAVAPARQRTGLGEESLRLLVATTAPRPLTVEATPECVSFYRKCGFRLISKRLGATGETVSRMAMHAPVTERPLLITGTRNGVTPE